MFKSSGCSSWPAGQAALMALALAACGERAPADSAADAARFPTERVAMTPLPSPDTVAEALIAHTTTPEHGRVLAPQAGAAGPTIARVGPPFQGLLYPPTNAAALTLTATLEADAWRLAQQYDTDGIDIVVETVGAAGVINTQHLVIDPGQTPASGSTASLEVEIPADAQRIEIRVDQRNNGALDNASVTASYR